MTVWILRSCSRYDDDLGMARVHGVYSSEAMADAAASKLTGKGLDDLYSYEVEVDPLDPRE